LKQRHREFTGVLAGGRGRLALAAALAALVAASCAATDEKTYVLEVRHHHFPNFQEEHRARFGEWFSIGDTEVEARVIRYEPDFEINLDTKEVGSRSEEPNNPAVQIEIREEGKETVRMWAFWNTPPHMGGPSPLVFNLTAVEDAAGTRLFEAPDVPGMMDAHTRGIDTGEAAPEEGGGW
jgi:hypothetical protein